MAAISLPEGFGVSLVKQEGISPASHVSTAIGKTATTGCSLPTGENKTNPAPDGQASAHGLGAGTFPRVSDGCIDVTPDIPR